jgi:hypothetical protein
MLPEREQSTYHGAIAEVSGAERDCSATLFGMLASGE